MPEGFSEGLVDERFDTVIIGSGLGSLTTAALLARSGQRVLVLERHYEPGGFTHTFSRKGYEWDVGLHYIGMVHRPGSPERRLFDYLTEGRLDWASMGSPYDRAVIDGKIHDFVPDPKEQLAQWCAEFPADADAIHRYWRLVLRVQKSAGLFFAEKAVPPWVSRPFGGLMRRPFGQLARRTTYDVLRELTDNEALITVLCAQCGTYGLAPAQSSFVIHAMVVCHFMHGGAFPCGGSRRVHESITKTIEDRGGVVALRASVERILTAGGRAAGLRLEGGAEIRASRVVSGVGMRNTFMKLLKEEDGPAIERIRGDLADVPPSLGHLDLYAGLDADDAALGLPKFNYSVYDSPCDEARMRTPDCFISFGSARDPEWPAAHPGKSTIQVILPAPCGEFDAWRETRWRKRGDAYEAKKAEFEARMLDKVYECVPQVRGHVAYTEVSTPLSTRHFLDYDDGEIYGLTHTPERFALPWLRPRTPIRGCYLTGQDTVSAGICGALVSGVLTASAILGPRAVKLMWSR